LPAAALAIEDQSIGGFQPGQDQIDTSYGPRRTIGDVTLDIPDAMGRIAGNRRKPL